MGKVNIDNGTFFLAISRTEKKLALWSYHHTAAPKLYAVGLAAGIRFEAYTVDGITGSPLATA